MNCNTNSGQIKHKEWLEVAKKHNIPTLIDIAADVPPIENFWKFNDLEISWDPAILPLTGQQVMEKLRDGEPGIELNAGKNNIKLVTFIMVPGEEKIVATRIKEELSKVR
ncbi:MAG: hypothetical protein Q8N05_03505 [Bacteroidota bacterium]|nr:hypothetical protein [Bacteroidota bacterium]